MSILVSSEGSDYSLASRQVHRNRGPRYSGRLPGPIWSSTGFVSWHIDFLELEPVLGPFGYDEPSRAQRLPRSSKLLPPVVVTLLLCRRGHFVQQAGADVFPVFPIIG